MVLCSSGVLRSVSSRSNEEYEVFSCSGLDLQLCTNFYFLAALLSFSVEWDWSPPCFYLSLNHFGKVSYGCLICITCCSVDLSSSYFSASSHICS